MKKVFMFMAAVAMFSFVACGGGNKSADSAKESAEKVETKSESAASSSNFDAYVKLIEEATPLLEKVANGDMEAIQEYAKIAEKMSEITANLQSELTSNPELMQKYTEVAQKFAEAAARVSGQ